MLSLKLILVVVVIIVASSYVRLTNREVIVTGVYGSKESGYHILVDLGPVTQWSQDFYVISKDTLERT